MNQSLIIILVKIELVVNGDAYVKHVTKIGLVDFNLIAINLVSCMRLIIKCSAFDPKLITHKM